MATGLILAAIVAVLDGRLVLMSGLLVAAFLLHVIMAAFGASYSLFLPWKPTQPPANVRRRIDGSWAALLLPLGWVFEPALWLLGGGQPPRARFTLCCAGIGTSGWAWLLHWRCSGWFRTLARNRQEPILAWVSERLVYFGVFQSPVALIMLLPAQWLERLRPLEPMRFLHLVYLLFVLLSGGLLGQYVLKKGAALVLAVRSVEWGNVLCAAPDVSGYSTPGIAGGIGE